MGLGRPHQGPQQWRALLHKTAFAALALHFCFSVLSRSRGVADSGIEFEGRDEEGYGGGSFAPFGPAVSATGGRPHESTRRPLDPHEMCGWETALESSTYDAAIDKGGWPTQWEQLVEESRPLTGVSCPVCGATHQTVQFRGMNVREEGRCKSCGSINRIRQLAEVILPEVSRITGRRVGSVKELAGSDLRIYNTQCWGGLHAVLKHAPGYACSEFISAELRPGEVVKNTRHEDLQRTTFQDESFDLVISSENLARVPSPYQALHELRRIMRPGAAHVFTVPFSPSDYHDQIRATVEEAKVVHHTQPLYVADRLHPKGVLLFTIFGRELADKMCMLGYNTTVHHLHNGPHGIIGHNAWVFSAVKP